MVTDTIPGQDALLDEFFNGILYVRNGGFQLTLSEVDPPRIGDGNAPLLLD
jgi:hypothetical protein